MSVMMNASQLCVVMPDRISLHACRLDGATRHHHRCSRDAHRRLTPTHAARVSSVAVAHTPDLRPSAASISAVPPFCPGVQGSAAILLGMQSLRGNKTQAACAGTKTVQSKPLLPATKESFQQYNSSTPAFSMAGTKCWGRLVDVYDGDTIKVVLPLMDKMFKFSVRLFGIDTCEIKSKTQGNKEKAVAARNRLVELGSGITPLPPIKVKKDIVKLLDANVSLVWVECLEFDKYGRLLAKVSSSPEQAKTFSQVLVDENLAYEYFGDTKLTESEQEALP